MGWVFEDMGDRGVTPLVWLAEYGVLYIIHAFPVMFWKWLT